jgi:lipopolysaccharide export system permease protein
MLFQQALRRDLFNLAGAVFATLFTVMVTTTSIRLLGGAAANRLASADVLPLIAFASVNYIPVLMVLTLYITVLLALTRAYRDSEMVVWFASGLSLRAWIFGMTLQTSASISRAFSNPYRSSVFMHQRPSTAVNPR